MLVDKLHVPLCFPVLSSFAGVTFQTVVSSTSCKPTMQDYIRYWPLRYIRTTLEILDSNYCNYGQCTHAHLLFIGITINYVVVMLHAHPSFQPAICLEQEG